MERRSTYLRKARRLLQNIDGLENKTKTRAFIFKPINTLWQSPGLSQVGITLSPLLVIYFIILPFQNFLLSLNES